ncbi:MAG: methyltransferase domain-containing protein [Bernardetiaceae bacterium]|nr:methyltransferase domain-containing protein [Bernardetiaceae bacterium]
MSKENQSIEALHQRETEFHDDWATSEALEDIEVHALFEGLCAIENQFIIQDMGNLQGKKILDVGAGLGESSTYFALQGAEVTYNDISPKMGELAQALAAHHGTSIKTVITPAEKMTFEADTFDFIYCANLMHHVPPEEQEDWIANMHHFLKKGGKLYTWDPIKYNPVINVYRRMATEVRTIDEMPLGFDILKLYRKYFTQVSHREFWLSTLYLFLHYYLIKRYNPNKVRYWKRIYKENNKTIGWWFKPLRALDSALLKLPLVRRLAWNMVVVAVK